MPTALPPSPIAYLIEPSDLAGHCFTVTLTLAQPMPEGCLLRLPAWLPGSYKIREFARHITQITAGSGRKPLSVRKVDKHSWQLAPSTGKVTVRYTVYAYDVSVRGAYLDGQRGFFNGANLCLEVVGQSDQPHRLTVRPPEHPDAAQWTLATSLPREGAGRRGFGHFVAANYDDLLDHPFEMGHLETVRFTACGVPHEIIVSGQHRGDLDRLAADVKKLCTEHLTFFAAPAPFARYVFLLHVGDKLYGGLEHRASTALMASRDALPVQGEPTLTEAYLDLLALFSHEYFHAWNVKRIKPAAFVPYDLSQEGYTRLLWAFEGITSYYDELALVRCGLLSIPAYLQRLADLLAAVRRAPGLAVQSVAEASFDAWIKYYQPDENSPNSQVSYYTKGALIALCLDLTLRQHSQGQVSLDTVMRALWQHTEQTGQGIAEDAWGRLAEAATGVPLTALLARWVDSTAPLPVEALLATVGVTLSPVADDTLAARLGVKAGGSTAEGWTLQSVYHGGAAYQAGLSGGDVLIAVDGLKTSSVEAQHTRYPAGSVVTAHAFRRDQLLSLSLTLPAAPHSRYAVTAEASRVQGWLTH